MITGLGTGGAERHLQKIIPRLKQDVFIISLTNLKTVGFEIEKEGVRIYYMGLSKHNLLKVIYKIGKVLKHEKPDILDTYLIHANILGRFIGKLYGIKNIINSVRNDYSDFKLLNFIDKNTQNLVDIYVPNSKALTGYLTKKNNIPQRKIEVLPNAIDINTIKEQILSYKDFNLKEKLKLTKKDKILTIVARLHKQKNIRVVVEAISILPKEYKLVLVGSDQGEKKNLTSLAKTLGIDDRVFFMGKRKEVFSILRQSHRFILPSLKEGMSNALLEAMALKTPCIVSNIIQNEELIKNGVNGYTFKVNSAKDLAKKIQMKITNKMIEESYQKILSDHTLESIKNKYEDIILKVRKNND